MRWKFVRQPDQAARRLAGGKLVKRVEEQYQRFFRGCQCQSLTELRHQVAVIGGDGAGLRPVAPRELMAQAFQQAAPIGGSRGDADEAVGNLCFGMRLLCLLDGFGDQGGFARAAPADHRQAAPPAGREVSGDLAQYIAAPHKEAQALLGEALVRRPSSSSSGSVWRWAAACGAAASCGCSISARMMREREA